MFGLTNFEMLVLFLLLVLTISNIFKKWNEGYIHVNRPKGPLGLPIIGHLLFLSKDPVKTFSKWRKLYGDVYRIKLGSWETVVVNGFPAISEATKNSDSVFSSRPPFLTQRVLRNLNFGTESLIFSPFDSSFERHKSLTSSALHMLVKNGPHSTQDMIITEAHKLADKLLDKYSSLENPVSIYDDIQLAVGTISYKLFLCGDEETHDVDENVKEIVQTTKDIVLKIGIGNPVEVMPWLENLLPWTCRDYSALLEKISKNRDQQIKNHIRSFHRCHIRDVIDAMLTQETDSSRRKNKSYCSQERLLYTVQDFIGGGFSTSVAMMIWFVKFMAAYPDVQQCVQEEIGVDRRLEYRDRVELPYTNAVFHEVMRMSSVLPFAFPHYTTEDTKFCGFDIKKDTVVILNLNSIAFDEEFWEDSHNFRPERFLTADGLDKAKCNRVVPFGIGRRKCVGEELVRMKMFLIFTTLLQKCTFIHEGKDIDPAPVPSLVFTPKPFRVLVRKRFM